MSEETKRKMSKNNARYWQGKRRSPETKEKIRQAQSGKKHSAETKAKMSASQPRDRISESKKKAVIQMDLSGKTIKQWPSMKEAELSLVGHVSGRISACCKGDAKTAYGFKWKIQN